MCSGLLQWVYEVKRMKNKVIHFVDILTVIFLSIQIQSTIVFIEERFSYLQNYEWSDYFYLYRCCGITDTILSSSFEKLYCWIVCIMYFSSFYVIVVKIKDIRKKELIHGACKWFIVTNILFVLLKTIEYYIYLITITHA